MRRRTIAGMVQKPMVVAHRGFSGKAPENTLTAFRMALEIEVDMIELDVQLSKDGNVVVIHDQAVNRTTNGKGKVAELSLDELKKLDAGSWFDASFADERIPTLQEALELITPIAYVNIEIKDHYSLRNEGSRVADATIKIVKEMGLFNRILFSSFNRKLIKTIKEKYPETHVGIIYHPIKHFRKLPSTLVLPVGGEVFICNRPSLNDRIIEDALKNNIVIGVYGIETEGDVQALLDMGIQVLVSDFPDMLVRMVQKFMVQESSNR